MSNNIIFGSVNTETGESLKGSIDKNGKMIYKRDPWWKRLFKKKSKSHLKDSLIGKTKIKRTNELGSFESEVLVYQTQNIYTGEIVCIYSNWNKTRLNFSVDGYKKYGQFFMTSVTY